MKSLPSGLIVVLAVLSGSPVHAQRLVLYDDFKLPLIDPNKWAPLPVGENVLDTARVIRDDHLWLAAKSYANPSSDVGLSFQGTGLAFSDPASVTAIRSTVTVIDTGATACPSNPGTFAAAQTTIQGSFFSAGTPTPGHAKDDVNGAVYLGHSPNDAPNVVRIYFSVFQCLDDFCDSTADLAGGSLGTTTTGQPVTVLIRWDRPNHRFIFRSSLNPPVAAPYSVADGVGPGFPHKFLLIANAIPNCTSSPRPTELMSAMLGSVFVNR
jgi:hypothetical protein